MAHLVQLDRDHPGFTDTSYRTRRDAIAQLAEAYRPGQPLPTVEYLAREHGVWATALEALRPLHRRLATSSYLAAWPILGFEPSRVPQMAEVSQRVHAAAGFRYVPVAGLVTPRDFMELLEAGLFSATQYMRHHSAPLYTPEPDVIHEFLGHAPLLADARHAEVNRLFGRATRAARDEATITALIRLYWYTLEFGVVRERGELKVIGAGLLSSFGELGRFEKEARLVPFDLDAIAATPFDPTQYQGTLFVADSEDAMLAALSQRLLQITQGGAV
jgi:phenylalanine-4-hydroxylase